MTTGWFAGENMLGEPVPYRSASKGRGIVDLLLLLAIAALFTLSSYALEYFGVPYDSSTGSILTKIHPATYLLVMALGLAIVANRNPVLYAVDLFRRCLGCVLLLVACLLLWWFISRSKPDYPASFLIDTLMGAALIFMLFRDADEGSRVIIARVVLAIMAINCLIALAEGITGWRLFPYVIGERAQSWDYRATALLGHPLGGALITGVCAVILMTVKDVRGLSERWRWPIIMLCLAAMPFIGSRTSFAVVYATAAVIGMWKGVQILYGAKISIRAVLIGLALAPFAIIAVAALLHGGLFDDFLARFTNDSGSAQTRVRLFQLFDDVDLARLLVGASSQGLEMSVRSNGLTEGIESSWVGHFMRYGILMATILWLGIAGCFADILRTVGRLALLPLAFVFLVTSTSVGISGKTTMLTLPVVLILALIKAPVPRPQPGRNELLSRIGTHALR